jgi:predicted metal-binding protein
MRVKFMSLSFALTGVGFATMEKANLSNPSGNLASAMRSLIFCTTCRHSAEQKTGEDGRTGGEALIAHMNDVLAAQGRADVRIQTQACLWNCKQHCSVVLQDDERFSYFTGHHAPSREQAEAILAWFDLHGQSETGEVPFRQWPDAMRGHFIARIPKAEG